DHLDAVAQTKQLRPEHTVAAKDKGLDITVGADGSAVATLPVGGISDFVAVIRLASTSRKPYFQLRFHRGPQGDHVVQVPAFERLSPPDPLGRAVGPHPCCRDFEIFTAPSTSGATLFAGTLPRIVPAPANEEKVVVISVAGSSVIVYEG